MTKFYIDKVKGVWAADYKILGLTGGRTDKEIGVNHNTPPKENIYGEGKCTYRGGS